MFTCLRCNKEFKSNQGLWSHNNKSNNCSFQKIKEKIELLEKENESQKDKIKELTIRLEEKTNNPTTISNTINQQTINNNILNVQCKTMDEYFKTIKGLPKIDMSESRIQNKAKDIATNMNGDKPINFDMTYYFERLFPTKDISDSVVIKDKKRNKIDVKYAGQVKPFEEHMDLICDVEGFGEECKKMSTNKHLDKAPKIAEFDSIYDCKRNVIKRNPDKTWKEIKDKQIITVE